MIPPLVNNLSYSRFRLLHDLSVCYLDGGEAQESEDVLWLAPGRGPGGHSVSAHDLGGHRQAQYSSENSDYLRNLTE